MPPPRLPPRALRPLPRGLRPRPRDPPLLHPAREPLSLDEAYLDVTALGRYAWDIAKEIRARIFETTRLTGSAGIAPNKMLAKIASDWRKPNGQFAITPDQIDAFMRDLPVRKVWGIGPKSAERFAAVGIHTCGDLQKIPLHELALRHGKWARTVFPLPGQDDRDVVPNRIRKSLSNERTYAENLATLAACQNAMAELYDELMEELRTKASERPVRKAFIKIKFHDFTRITRECLCDRPDIDTFRRLLTQGFESSPRPSASSAPESASPTNATSRKITTRRSCWTLESSPCEWLALVSIHLATVGYRTYRFQSGQT